ncbi:26S protease regulatory subunit 6B [Spironucleus salmonicida]|uniref:26S protease regulatory subunit 6B n=1 Tax=Spironucleus salmonicida TaxID=348837 RepID=V6LML0_9EUKA|nr:26S protease regulatory subunit 6B [Spironucleus salmonicida]|eukprot:EST44946.1 26S protease regulatory subunit 6B [Spironucleus salmonicida]
MSSQFQTLRDLESKLQFLDSQISFLQQDYQHLRTSHSQLLTQYSQLHQTPLLIGSVVEPVDAQRCIVQPSNLQSNVLVRVSSHVNPAHIKPMANVALNRTSYAVHKVLPVQNEQNQNLVNVEERPNITFADIGGYDSAKQDLREAVEMPIKQPHIFKQLNIVPPNAVLLFGPPGNGKSLLVKAIANACDCTFINISSSQCVQKYLGEGARMIRDIFKLARDMAPSVVFFDEVDAIATKRYDNATDGDKEVQRILLELLTQLDGFNNPEHFKQEQVNEYDDQETIARKLNRGVVKVIFATNKPDTLDPALLRTGRCDRKVEITFPNKREKRLIFQVCSKKMNLEKDVDFEVFVSKNAKISGADIAHVCREAGMQAVRNNRFIVSHDDFEKAWDVTIAKRKNDIDE